MMPTADLESAIRGVLRAQLPFLESATVDRLTAALLAGIEVRDRSMDRLLTRAQLADRLAVERHLPVPASRPLAASRPNLDTPEVVAARLKILAEMPAYDGPWDGTADPDDPVDEPGEAMNSHTCKTSDGARITCLCSTGRDHTEEEFDQGPDDDPGCPK